MHEALTVSAYSQLLYAANMQVFMHAKLPHAPCVSQPIHVSPQVYARPTGPAHIKLSAMYQACQFLYMLSSQEHTGKTDPAYMKLPGTCYMCGSF